MSPYASDTAVRPALVAAVRSAAGALTGAHLTFLQADGARKAEIAPNRKMVGTVGGCHVRLLPGADLVVAEGLESALSAWGEAANLGAPAGLGAVAALSAGGVARFEWPAGTRSLIIAPDRDASGTGEKAADALARRAHAYGLKVSILAPPVGATDWNEAVRQDRCAA